MRFERIMAIGIGQIESSFVGKRTVSRLSDEIKTILEKTIDRGTIRRNEGIVLRDWMESNPWGELEGDEALLVTKILGILKERILESEKVKPSHT